MDVLLIYPLQNEKEVLLLGRMHEFTRSQGKVVLNALGISVKNALILGYWLL